MFAPRVARKALAKKPRPANAAERSAAPVVESEPGAARRGEALGGAPRRESRSDFSFADLALLAPGENVPDPMRSRFEQRTGTSLGSVRVHRGSLSQAAASALEARAFTVGRDVHFGASEYRPGTPEGDHLLAHELAHTVQPCSEATPTGALLKGGRQDEAVGADGAEREADAVADAVTDAVSADHEYGRHGRSGDGDGGGGEGTPGGAGKIPPIARRRGGIALAPKKKPEKKPAKKTPAAPKQPTAAPKAAAAPKAPPTPKVKLINFSLFSANFKATVDGAGNVTVKAAGKTDGWSFTAAGANAVTAERTPEHAEYRHAGGSSEPMVERASISVPSGGPATVGPIEAVLGAPARLTVVLGADRHASMRKSLPINGAAVDQLDLPASAITFKPVDGDAIRLGSGDAWVFSTLKGDPVPPAKATTDVQGFFAVGSFTRYKDHGKLTEGIDSPPVSNASRTQAFKDLTDPAVPAGRRITAEEADAFETTSVIESDFAGVQTYDRGVLSFGFAQWTVKSDLPKILTKVDPAVFERHLGRYGLKVGPPVRQLDKSVGKFIVGDRGDFGVRNPSEMALSLNGRELVTPALLAKAASRAKELDAQLKIATQLKADVAGAKLKLASTDKAEKAAGKKAMSTARGKFGAVSQKLSGLPGLKTDKDPEKQADILVAVATNAHDAAQGVVDNCSSIEVMRTPEWALRFELLGKDAGGQDAEVAQARETFAEAKSEVTHGASFATLLPNERGRAALFSSYLNNPNATKVGMSKAVDEFKSTKQAEAKKATAAALAAKKAAPPTTEADWAAFPWKSGDARWTTLWPHASGEFEKVAIVEVTANTTDTDKRRKAIADLHP